MRAHPTRLRMGAHIQRTRCLAPSLLRILADEAREGRARGGRRGGWRAVRHVKESACAPGPSSTVRLRLLTKQYRWRRLVHGVWIAQRRKPWPVEMVTLHHLQYSQRRRRETDLAATAPERRTASDRRRGLGCCGSGREGFQEEGRPRIRLQYSVYFGKLRGGPGLGLLAMIARCILIGK